MIPHPSMLSSTQHAVHQINPMSFLEGSAMEQHHVNQQAFMANMLHQGMSQGLGGNPGMFPGASNEMLHLTNFNAAMRDANNQFSWMRPQQLMPTNLHQHQQLQQQPQKLQQLQPPSFDQASMNARQQAARHASMMPTANLGQSFFHQGPRGRAVQLLPNPTFQQQQQQPTASIQQQQQQNFAAQRPDNASMPTAMSGQMQSQQPQQQAQQHQHFLHQQQPAFLQQGHMRQAPGLQFMWPSPVRPELLNATQAFNLHSQQARMFGQIKQFNPGATPNPALYQTTPQTSLKSRVAQLTQLSGLTTKGRFMSRQRVPSHPGMGGYHAPGPRQFTSTRGDPGEIDDGNVWGRDKLANAPPPNRDFPSIYMSKLSQGKKTKKVNGSSSNINFFDILLRTPLNEETEISIRRRLMMLGLDSEILIPKMESVPLSKIQMVNGSSNSSSTKPSSSDANHVSSSVSLESANLLQQQPLNSPSVPFVNPSQHPPNSSAVSFNNSNRIETFESPSISSKSPVTASSVDDSPLTCIEGELTQTINNDFSKNVTKQSLVIDEFPITFNGPPSDSLQAAPTLPVFSTLSHHGAESIEGLPLIDHNSPKLPEISSPGLFMKQEFRYPIESLSDPEVPTGLPLLTAVFNFLDAPSLVRCELLCKGTRRLIRFEVPELWGLNCRLEEDDLNSLYTDPTPPHQWLQTKAGYADFHKMKWLTNKGAIQALFHHDRLQELNNKTDLEKMIAKLSQVEYQNEENQIMLKYNQNLLTQMRKTNVILTDLKYAAKSIQKILRSLKRFQSSYARDQKIHSFITELLAKPWANTDTTSGLPKRESK